MNDRTGPIRSGPARARVALGRSRARALGLAGAGDRVPGASSGGTSPASWPAAGHRVRGLSRRPPVVEPGDPPIDWVVGDLRDADVRRRALAGVRGVIHAAGWVSLGLDPRGTSHAINVEATAATPGRGRARPASSGSSTRRRSTPWPPAPPDEPADEFAAWNLGRVDSPYTRTKREAERLVLEAGRSGLSTIAHLPRDGDGSARYQADFDDDRPDHGAQPGGGVAARRDPDRRRGLLATAHRRALVAGGSGQRYAVVGPYLSYPELAAVVASIPGRPRWVVTLPDRWSRVLAAPADWIAPMVRRWIPDLSRPAHRRRVPPAARRRPTAPISASG